MKITTSLPTTHPDGSVSFVTTVKPAPVAPAPVPHPVPVPAPTPTKAKAMLIQVTNHSTVIGPAEFLNMVTACAAQIRDEFATAWEKVPPTVEANLNGVEDPKAYQMGIFDTSDQPGALGYHDTDAQGKPRGFVFAKTTKEDGGNVSTTLSHELCEMVLDPTCTLWTQTNDGNMRALEACDAVEADEYEKDVGGTKIKVSNFLLPSYFSSAATGPTDYLNKLNGQIAPARTPGGYDILIDTSGQPSQEFSRHMASLSPAKAAMKGHSGSRTSRRTRKP
jgi:hypothetical protein